MILTFFFAKIFEILLLLCKDLLKCLYNELFLKAHSNKGFYHIFVGLCVICLCTSASIRFILIVNKSVPQLKNKLLGGEGLFNTVLTGPGRVWLQTMPICNVAASIRPFIPTGNG